MKYRADIDGLRTIAVMSVVLTHTGLGLVRGGFVGVDIFFVISGYLITKNVMSEIRDGRFSIVKFYERRARRILPALFFLLAVALPVITFFYPAANFQDNMIIGLSAVFSISNLVIAANPQFDMAPGMMPLVHTWSLGVEEQFYIVFPALLMLVYGWLQKNIWIMIAGLMAVSFTWAAIATINYDHADFFVPQLRAWELMVGAVLVFVPTQLFRNQKVNEISGFVGLAMIAVSVMFYKSSNPNIPGPLALMPTLGAALIILSGGRSTFVDKCLSLKPMVGIGLISYSLYLWHWPIFEFYRVMGDHGFNLGFTAAAALTLLSIFIAYLSWRYIEKPFRGSASPIRAHQIGIGAVVGLFVISAFGILTIAIRSGGASL